MTTYWLIRRTTDDRSHSVASIQPCISDELEAEAPAEAPEAAPVAVETPVIVVIDSLESVEL